MPDYFLILENEKVIGVSHQFLNKFNLNSLEDLLSHKNEIAKIFSNIYTDQTINFFNTEITVNKISFLGIKNIELLKITILSDTKKSISNFDEEEMIIKLDPLEETISKDYQFENHQNKKETHDNTEINLNFEKSLQIDTNIEIEKEFQNIINDLSEPDKINALDQINEIAEEKTIKTNELKQSDINKNKKEDLLNTSLSQKENKKIQLFFEDEISKVKKVLNIDKDLFYLDKQVKQEINNAKEELGLDENWLKNMTIKTLQEIEEEKKAFYYAIKEKDYNKIHSLSHRLKGAALNLRLEKIAFTLKTIDELSKKQEDIKYIQQIVDLLYQYIEKIKNILSDKKEKKDNNLTKENKAIQNIHLTDKQKTIILKYLQTATPEKFKKDKKFLQKMLNIKGINSLEDLKKLL